MGFRDLHYINLAMFTKQGWKLIQNTTSLEAKILKASIVPPEVSLEHIQEKTHHLPSIVS